MAIEGPEAAAYTRGTATLVNGDGSRLFKRLPLFLQALHAAMDRQIDIIREKVDTFHGWDRLPGVQYCGGRHDILAAFLRRHAINRI